MGYTTGSNVKGAGTYSDSLSEPTQLLPQAKRLVLVAISFSYHEFDCPLTKCVHDELIQLYLIHRQDPAHIDPLESERRCYHLVRQFIQLAHSANTLPRVKR